MILISDLDGCVLTDVAQTKTSAHSNSNLRSRITDLQTQFWFYSLTSGVALLPSIVLINQAITSPNVRTITYAGISTLANLGLTYRAFHAFSSIPKAISTYLIENGMPHYGKLEQN